MEENPVRAKYSGLFFAPPAKRLVEMKKKKNNIEPEETIGFFIKEVRKKPAPTASMENDKR